MMALMVTPADSLVVHTQSLQLLSQVDEIRAHPSPRRAPRVIVFEGQSANIPTRPNHAPLRAGAWLAPRRDEGERSQEAQTNTDITKTSGMGLQRLWMDLRSSAVTYDLCGLIAE
jgi:hypothetical protein